MQLTAKRLGSSANESDMIVLRDVTGVAWAMVHVDVFYSSKGTIYKALRAGRKVVLDMQLEDVIDEPE